LNNGITDAGLFGHRTLALNDHQRDSINEKDDIGPVGLFGPFNPELIDCQKLVFFGLIKIDESNRLLLSSGADILINGDSRNQILVEFLVGLHQAFGLDVGYSSYGLVDTVFSQVRIDFRKLLFEPVD